MKMKTVTELIESPWQPRARAGVKQCARPLAWLRPEQLRSRGLLTTNRVILNADTTNKICYKKNGKSWNDPLLYIKRRVGRTKTETDERRVEMSWFDSSDSSRFEVFNLLPSWSLTADHELLRHRHDCVVLQCSYTQCLDTSVPLKIVCYIPHAKDRYWMWLLTKLG